jgi:mono/diheme cytochrome c family protein
MLRYVLLSFIVGASTLCVFTGTSQAASSGDIAHGRYLTVVAGCNDCHTPGWLESGGNVPEEQWLTGGDFGWHGPWGTTYPANLRLLLPSMTEKAWVEFAHTLKTRPPMPWWSLHAMSASDLRDIYAFVTNLGPGGRPAPTYVPPGGTIETPYVDFDVRPPPKQK